METTKSASRPRSSLLSWITGLKDAWEQAKNDYKEHRSLKQRSAKGLTQRFDDLCKESVPRAGRKSVSSKRQRRSRKAIAHETTQETIPCQPTKIAASKLSLYVSQEDSSAKSDHNNTAKSILDASFLRKIRDPPVFNPESAVSTNDNPAATDEEDTLSSNRKRKLDESTGTVDTARIDEEYVNRVHLRVQQLEAELEAARARLQEYETSGVRRPGPDVAVGGCTSHDSSTTQGLAEESEHGEHREDPFILSPSKLEFSPIRVQLADVSNGELARREALQALKQRIKRKGES